MISAKALITLTAFASPSYAFGWGEDTTDGMIELDA